MPEQLTRRLKDANDAVLLPISNATQTALAAKADLINGKIPATQIPAGTGKRRRWRRWFISLSNRSE